MRSISEFIMEQETNTSVSGSDNLVKAYSECVCALALAKCYTEHAAIMEFAAENGIDSLSIVMESGEGESEGDDASAPADDANAGSGETKEKKENIFKRAGGAVKNAWGKVVEFFKTIHRKITAVIVDKRMAGLVEAAKELKADAEFKDISEDIEVFPKFVSAFADSVQAVLDSYSGTMGETATAEKALNDIIGDGEKKEAAKKTYTGAQIKSLIGDKYEKGKIQSELKKAEKAISELEKATKKLGKDESKKAEVDTNKGNIEKMKNFINLITKAYDKALNSFQKTYSALKKGIAAGSVEQTKESFYFV